MFTGTSRWENAEPLSALDAQIRVLEAARADVRAELPHAEELVVRAMAVGGPAVVEEACAVVEALRAASHDFTVELDELSTERSRIVPWQRRAR